jgi:hypothetical protein
MDPILQQILVARDPFRAFAQMLTGHVLSESLAARSAMLARLVVMNGPILSVWVTIPLKKVFLIFRSTFI